MCERVEPQNRNVKDTSPGDNGRFHRCEPACRTAVEAITRVIVELQGTLGAISQRLDVLDGGQKTQADRLDGVEMGLAELHLEKRVLAEMHDQRRELAEQFHEREFLGPVFFGLIGIADRCRQGTARLRRLLNNLGNDASIEIVTAVKCLVDARNADLTEAEGLLADRGVERFTTPEDTFVPNLQNCVARVPAEDPSLHGRVAQHLLPGYRRSGQVLRPERVSVYVFTQKPLKDRS